MNEPIDMDLICNVFLQTVTNMGSWRSIYIRRIRNCVCLRFIRLPQSGRRKE